MARNYFSLELGEHHLKIADVEKKDKFFEVSSLTLAETDKFLFTTNSEKVYETQGNAISKLLASSKITKRNVNIIIPDGQSYSQIIEMPPLKEKELLSAIKYQADQFIPMSIEEVTLDVEVLSEIESTKQLLVLISAAPKKTIEVIQRVVEHAGLIADSIETEISAMGRFLSSEYSKTSSPQGALFINLGFSSTSLYYFNERLGLITQSHNFNIGYQLFLKEIQLNLNKTETDAMALLKTAAVEATISVAIKNFMFELQRFISLVVSKNQQSIRQIHIYNEAIMFPALKTIIEQALKVPVSFLDILPLIKNQQMVAQLKDKLGYFPSLFGGNLR